MKKVKIKMPKTNLLKEFKTFITRGNVVDLAVGMIIGAAFTAIVNGLVNYIFKPLINAIPMGDVSGLITMLVPKDSNGVQVAFGSAAIDLSKSVFIDWGSFIMAIINFLITALVLFFLVKGINALRDGFGKVKNDVDKLSNKEIKSLLKQGKTIKEIKEIEAQKAADAKAAAEAEAAQKAAEAAKVETSESLLKEIRDLLKAQQISSTAAQTAVDAIESESKQ